MPDATMIERNQQITLAHLGMLLRAFVLALSFTLVGLTGEGLPPLLLTALRFSMAAIALLPLVWRAPGWLPGARAFAVYGILGGCQAAFFTGMFWTAHRLSALSMTLLYISVPFLAYALGLGFRVEQPSGRLLGILTLGGTGAFGLAWAESGGNLGGLRLGVPEIAYFAGCLGLALYSVLSRWALSRHWVSELAAVRTFWSVSVGGVLVGALGLIEEKPQALAHLTLRDVLLLAYLGVVSTGGTFWLMQRAVAVMTAPAATAYTYATPFVSMLLLFVDEPQRISWHWLPGASLVQAMALLFCRGGIVLRSATISSKGVR
jgi:drug/metabolite transporter (DMT)-like permease